MRIPPLLRAGRIPGALCAAITLLVLCGGCAHNPRNPDPFEKVNRVIYKFNDGLDKFILKPASGVYVKVFPRQVRTGVSNFFDNLGIPNVILNDLLQARWGRALGAAGRMAVNTTVGIGGVFDPATKWKLPDHDNDFGITLGKWGAGPGPYLMLPLYGPSTPRDAPKILVKMYTNPLRWVEVPPAVNIPLGILNVLDDRARADAILKFRDQAAIDPYIFVRDAYLQLRHALIYGEQAPPVDPDFYNTDSGPSTTRTTPSP